MVLFVATTNGRQQCERCPKSAEDLLASSSALKNRTLDFMREPVRSITPQDGLVYVGQGELAVGQADDNNVHFFGSEDATTCHVIILRHVPSSTVALAHLDQADNDQLWDLSAKLLDQSSDDTAENDLIEVYVVGGYDDERGLSGEISKDLLQWMFMVDFHFSVEIFASGPINTKFSNGLARPVLYGAAVELRSGEVLPATFPDHGPDNILRHVRLSLSERETNLIESIYNSRDGRIVIPAFKAQELPQHMEIFIRVPDYTILRSFSTSPKVEPPYFASEIRQSLEMVLRNPNFETSFFPLGKPRIYERCEVTGYWNLLPENG